MDKEKIGRFAEFIYRDIAGTMAIGMGYLGLRNGLFETMSGAGAVTPEELAKSTGLQPRYVEEWLNGMTAAGWLEYDPESRAFRLPDEHAFLLASEGTDHFMGGLLLAGPALLSQAQGVAKAFKEGGGVSFEKFGDDWIEAMDLMNSGPYIHRLTSYWLAKIPDVENLLKNGGSVLDIGCGVGRVVHVLADAYPNAKIVGVDPDQSSIAQARQTTQAKDAERIHFIEGTVEDLAKDDKYDFATLFDCLHDLTDPVDTLVAIHSRLSPNGALMVMEPKAADRLEDNINSLGAAYYGFSLFHCMTQSLARGGPGMGTCMGPEKTMALLNEGGFSTVEELAINSQTNLFYVARK